MLDKDSTHCAILSLLAISAILLLWHINQMGAKSTSTPAARLYGVGGSMLPARLAKKEPYGVGGSMLPARLSTGLAVGPVNPAPARLQKGMTLNGATIAEQAAMIGTAHLHRQSPIQSRVSKDSLGVTSGRIFGMRK